MEIELEKEMEKVMEQKMEQEMEQGLQQEIEREQQQQQQPECHLMERDEDMSWQDAASNCAKWGMQLANPNIASVEVKLCACASVCV